MRISLKGKLGENPTLSRNCNSERICYATVKNGKAGGALMISQETCLVLVHTQYLRGNRWCSVRNDRKYILRFFNMHR